jgi:hypothetical protein
MRRKKSFIPDYLTNSDRTEKKTALVAYKGKDIPIVRPNDEYIIHFLFLLQGYKRNRNEKLRINIEETLVNLFYTFKPHDQTRLLAIFLNYPDEIINELNLELKVVRDINYMILSTFTLLTTNEYKRKLSKILVQSEKTEYGLDKIFKKIIFNEKLLKFNRLLTSKKILEVVEPEFEFFRDVLDRNKFLFKPNKKYSSEMFNFTSDMIFKGLKDYVAFEETLKQFGFDVNKGDSYRKRYKAYLKEK